MYTLRRRHTMANLPFYHVLLFVAIVVAEPTPGRIPKVYNALITSNQNLEPSKAFPVYQPVIHDPFLYPFQPFIYPGDVANSIPYPDMRRPSSPPGQQYVPPQTPTGYTPEVKTSAPETTIIPAEAQNPKTDESRLGTTPSPLPPRTESPIPLNKFGLPSQLVPLGRFNPSYPSYQVFPFSYSFPGYKFYDAYNPFLTNPYLNYPSVYRPMFNPQIPNLFPEKPLEEKPMMKTTPATTEEVPSTPPSEPDDLSVLNYAPKDPSIPDVPPPPIPTGGGSGPNEE